MAKLEAETAERKRELEEARRLNEQLERRVAELTAELKDAKRELEAFSFSVSHDLRAPLANITGFSDLLLKFHSQHLPALARTNVEGIRDATRRMGALIEDLLNLSRINQHELRRAETDLSALATEIIAEIRRDEPKRKVDCRVAPDLVVNGDPGLLRIALDSLLRNAWKFTSKTARAAIEVGSSTRDGQRVFFVRDNGAGFDMKYAHRLFAPFQRLHVEEDFPGTGIGLAVVNRIVRRHRGEVWPEAEVDKGATFHFTLGAAPDQAAASTS